MSKKKGKTRKIKKLKKTNSIKIKIKNTGKTTYLLKDRINNSNKYRKPFNNRKNSHLNSQHKIKIIRQ